MKKINRICIVLLICLAASYVFTACGFIGSLFGDGDQFDFKDYDYFKANTKNYSMTINDSGDVTVIKVCEKGYLLDSGSSIYFYNGAEKKGYMLDKDARTGVVNTYESGENLYDWENGGMIDLLYSFQFLKLLMKKDGTDKIAGRDCTIYSYSADGVSSKYWLDNELGMCLKSEIKEDGKTDTMEITEFVLGGVTLANMIDLSAYTIEDVITPVKTVKSIAVKSGSIPTGKTVSSFVLSDIKITVIYEDDSEEDISLAGSMLSAADNVKLDTAGTHTITVTFGGKTAVFTVTLTESGQTSSPIVDSIESFYSNIAFDLAATANGFMPELALKLALGQYSFKDYYDESVEGKADTGMWSAPNLLLDASMQINAYLEGVFEEEELDFGSGVKKTPSCTATAEGYSVKYGEKKGLYTYWFETEIKFDEATGSLRAEIFSGVNEQKGLNYIIEYNINTDGNYAAVIYYPDDITLGNSAIYTALKLYFKGASGKVSINRLQSRELSSADLLFKKADNAAYADAGDAVICLDGTSVTCPVDNLTSGFYRDFNALLEMLTENCDSIYNAEEGTEEADYFDSDTYSLLYLFDYIYVGGYSLPDIIKTYDNKRLLEKEEGAIFNVSRTGDTYTVTYEDEYNVKVATVKYDGSGSFLIEHEEEGEFTLRLQWVKIGSTHFVEAFDDDYGTRTQYKYAFNMAQNTTEFVRIFELDTVVRLNIYKATNLTLTAFAARPASGTYNHYSYNSNGLSYSYGE